MKNIYAYLFNKLEEKESLAFATIIEARGSTPQVPGASAIFSPEGLLKGTLGGGLLEADAQKKALQALKKKDSILYEFSLLADTFSDQEPICGGDVKVLIDTFPEKHKEAFNSLIHSLNQHWPGVLATVINRLSEKDVSLSRFWIEGKAETTIKTFQHLSFFQEEIKKALSEGMPRLLDMKEKNLPEKAQESLLFLEPVYPSVHLVIAGAGHVGQAVAHLGNFLNFEVTVIDDRPDFANKGRLPDADHIIVSDFSKALQEFLFSSDTYIVIVTRGHQHDATVLRQCIASEAGYIGMIGSARKIELMRKKFLEEGWATRGQFGRIYAPVGIEINSKTVEEIAVSIAAQLVLVRSQLQNRKERT